MGILIIVALFFGGSLVFLGSDLATFASALAMLGCIAAAWLLDYAALEVEGRRTTLLLLLAMETEQDKSVELLLRNQPSMYVDYVPPP